MQAITHGGIVTKEKATKVAKHFFTERVSISNNFAVDKIAVAGVRENTITAAQYYICEMLPLGFVIVSGCDKIQPILAYSFESKYPEESALPLGFTIWMNNYKNQIDYALKNDFEVEVKIKSEWERLLSENVEVYQDFDLVNSVEPLLYSKWNQSNPYNNWCPIDPNGPGGRCYAGCVATALGQLLYYYRFPYEGQGEYTYTHPMYGTISANFGTSNYDWFQMPSTITTNTDEIGKLLFHQGVAVDMDYGPDGSGMWNHKAAYSLKTYFKYGPETQYYFRDSTTIDWDSLLIANLNQRKPLYYAGWAGVQSNNGHAFVCDGYQPGNFYHFNWGWGGSLDGYFYTDNLTPGGNIFNFAQEVIPLFPDTIQNIYPKTYPEFLELNAVKGSVEDGSGWYNYKNNLYKKWYISPQGEEYDSIQSIKITFNQLNIEDNKDSIFIYNGENENAPLVNILTGNTIPPSFVVQGNKLLVVFKTNETLNSKGWQFDYMSQFPIYCSGITTLNAQSGSLEDGSEQKKYNNNSLCRWKIIPTENKPVTLIFTSFALADSGDFVKIIDLQTQEILGNFTGNQIPFPITANSGKMLIMFVTNGNNSEKGWSAEYYASQTELSEDYNSDAYEVYPNPTRDLLCIERKSKESSAIKISLVNIYGLKIFSKTHYIETESNKIYINLGNLPKLAYFLIIEENENKIIRKKIILQ